jgi:hypothetical protein
MFDHWDHEFQTGQDTESTVLFFALCVGATLVALRAVVRICEPSRSQRLDSPCRPFDSLLDPMLGAASAAALFPSPPANLRI